MNTACLKRLVTSVSYCDLLRNHLRPAIRLGKCRLLSTGVLLQHDTAWPHTVHVTRHDQGHSSASLILWTCLTPLLFHLWGHKFLNWHSTRGGATVTMQTVQNIFPQGIQATVQHWRTSTEHMCHKLKMTMLYWNHLHQITPQKILSSFGFTYLCIINTWNYYITFVWQF